MPLKKISDRSKFVLEVLPKNNTEDSPEKYSGPNEHWGIEPSDLEVRFNKKLNEKEVETQREHENRLYLWGLVLKPKEDERGEEGMVKATRTIIRIRRIGGILDPRDIDRPIKDETQATLTNGDMSEEWSWDDE